MILLVKKRGGVGESFPDNTMKKFSEKEKMLALFLKIYPGYSPKKLGEKINTPGPTVSNWASGRKKIPLSRASEMNKIQPFKSWGLSDEDLKFTLESKAGGVEMIALMLMSRVIDDDDLIDGYPETAISDVLKDVLKHKEEDEINEVTAMRLQAEEEKYEAWLKLKEARGKEKRLIQEEKTHLKYLLEKEDIIALILDELYQRGDLLITSKKEDGSFNTQKIFKQDGTLQDNLEDLVNDLLIYMMDDGKGMDYLIPLPVRTQNDLLKSLKETIENIVLRKGEQIQKSILQVKKDANNHNR